MYDSLVKLVCLKFDDDLRNNHLEVSTRSQLCIDIRGELFLAELHAEDRLHFILYHRISKHDVPIDHAEFDFIQHLDRDRL